MLDLIIQINEKNSIEFIEKYGKISDKAVAIELLGITSNAWLILDDSIKTDNEVIMYYQPMGIMYANIAEDLGGVFEDVYSSYLSQNGFKLVNGIQIPEIEIPSDFDMEKYIMIQKELSKEKQIFSNEDIIYRGEQDMGQIINNITFDKEKIKNFDSGYNLRFRGKEANRVFTSYEIYDRSKLIDIVNNIYISQKETKTK